MGMPHNRRVGTTSMINLANVRSQDGCFLNSRNFEPLAKDTLIGIGV